MICAASIRLVQHSVQCSAVYVCIPPAEDKAIYNTRGLKRLLFPPHIIIIHTPTNITVFLFLHTYITYNPLLQVLPSAFVWVLQCIIYHAKYRHLLPVFQSQPLGLFRNKVFSHKEWIVVSVKIGARLV